MVTLTRRKVVYEDGEFGLDEVMSIKDAAEALGLSLQGVISALDRGRFTELIDPDAGHSQQRRRFLLRSEVEDESQRRLYRTRKWGEEEGEEKEATD